MKKSKPKVEDEELEYSEEGFDEDYDDDFLEFEETPVSSKTEASAVNKASAELPIEFSQMVLDYAGTGSSIASRRLFEELRKLDKKQFKKFGYEVAPVGDLLYQWSVKLFDFPDDCPLYSDLQKYQKKYKQDFVKMEILFPKDYPFSPPFIRVISPRFTFHTGHVTIGGSICMEVLTKSGWMPTYSLESLLMQIKSEMVEGKARIDFDNHSIYTEQEARSAFNRVAQDHKWKV